jgi:hypothetical protein
MSSKDEAETDPDEPDLPTENEPDLSISVYGDFIKEQIDAEVVSRSSLEQRGLAVITTSGALVTLLFGLVAVLTKANTFVLPASSRSWLKWAMLFFVLGAVCGIITNFPLLRRGARPNDLGKVIADNWADPPSMGQRAVAQARIDILRNAILLNLIKGSALLAAMIAEVIAVLFVALAVSKILTTA